MITIKIDYDRWSVYSIQRKWKHVWPVVNDDLRVRVVDIRSYRSASGRGWHVEVDCQNMPNRDIIILQACLGSDARRELHNLGRVRSADVVTDFRDRGWNILFEGKFDDDDVFHPRHRDKRVERRLKREVRACLIKKK